jgi:hypothetical protein
MPIQILPSTGSVFTVKISGQMTPQDLAALQKAAADWIVHHERPNFLAIAEGFTGWSQGDWDDDLSFRLKFDKQIHKIAIVAEPKWTDSIALFMGQGLRRVEIRNFSPGEMGKARGWLEE